MEVLRLDDDELRPLALMVQPRTLQPLEQRPEPAPRLETNIAAVLEHPLFYVSRTRWAPPPAPVEEPPPPAPSTLNNYSLVGVIVSGTSRSALIRLAGEGRTILLSEGQELEGWTLREVTRERLYFTSGDSSYEMPLLKPSETKR